MDLRRPRLAVWCEFLPYADVLKTLPALSRHECQLLLHVGPEDVGNPALLRVFRAARQQGVDVGAWFLLPYDQHLYVGEATVDVVRDLSRRFAAWAKEEDLGVKWLVFDCEPSPLLGRELFATVRRGRVLELARVLRNEKDAERFRQSVEELNALIDELHGRGFLVMGAANRAFLDFLRRGNTAIQDSLNAPFSMIHWDRASFITYRYKLSQDGYVALVNRYAELAHRFFGDRAALDLGLIGDQRDMPEHRERAALFGGESQFIGYLDGMRSVYEMQEVIGVSLYHEVSYINLYSLDGAVTSVAGLDLWLKAAAESRPATRWSRLRPIGSLKLGMVGALLDGLYRALVTRDAMPYPVPAGSSP